MIQGLVDQEQADEITKKAQLFQDAIERKDYVGAANLQQQLMHYLESSRGINFMKIDSVKSLKRDARKTHKRKVNRS